LDISRKDYRFAAKNGKFPLAYQQLHINCPIYHHYQIVNRENTDEIIPGLEFVLVELTDKFRPETVGDCRLMTLWLRFLKETGEKMRKLPPKMQENEYIRKAAELCESAAFIPAELAAYDKYWDAISIEITLLTSERQKGKAEGKAEVVLNAHKAGYSIETIAAFINLTLEQITEILKHNS
jgi:hypothetical protein